VNYFIQSIFLKKIFHPMKISRKLCVKRKLMLSTLVLSFLAVASCNKDTDKLVPVSQQAALIGAAAPSTSSDSNLIYKESFEGSAPFSTYATRQSAANSYAFNVVSDIVFEGNKAGRFELRDTDPEASGGTRTEVKFPELENPNRWYSFSVYFPSSGYKYDSKAEIINQWHQGGGTSPSISLITRYDHLSVETRSEPGVKSLYDLGALVKDKWHTIVMHIVHSHGSDGLIEIWQNGEKIFTRSGANSYDFASFDKPKWKLGMYKWDWNGTGTTDTKVRVIYFDNIRLGNEKATYANMVSKVNTITEPTPVPPTDTVTVPAPTPTPEPTTGAIKNFTLIDAATEKDIKTIINNETISLSAFSLLKANIRANLTSTSYKSVKFELSGAQTYSYADSGLPYALFGDDGNGNFYYGIWKPPTVGKYTLKATPYTGSKLTGTAGTPSVISFTIAK
jgi:hypothetical protein